jgi:hypothetical protein
VNPAEAVAAAVAAAPDALFVSSLGTATSALRLASDDGPHLYLGAAMGSGVATALGVAERCREQQVVAIVGDGDLLMGAGTLWTLAGLAPPNLAVLVLRDGAYSITGGQALVETDSLGSVCAGFSSLATAEAETPAAVEEALRSIARPGIVLAEIGESEWPGPSPFVEPASVRARFAERAAEPAG